MQSIVIFTDGACSGNPGPGGWGSIISTPDGQIEELGGGEKGTTNNRMEMTAAIRALNKIEPSDAANILLYTDSTYVIRGITQWVHGWRQRGWKNAEGKDVANRELWEEMLRQVMRLKPAKVEWKYVRGHSGFDGNERCDQIAVAFSKGYDANLYIGPRSGYAINIEFLPAEDPLPEQKSGKGAGSSSKSGSSSASKNGAQSYLSYLSGVVVRHTTWTACERRVKGQPAKFKKAKSKQEELEILTSWGLDSRTAIVED